MQNDNAIWLISGWSRCRVTFDEDGFIYNMGSSGAADNIYAVYAIGEDESSLKVRDYFPESLSFISVTNDKIYRFCLIV